MAVAWNTYHGAHVQTSSNLNGSLPASEVDSHNFEPNFRHFDFMYDSVVLPDAQLLERLFVTAPGEAHPAGEALRIWHMRSTPVLVLGLCDAVVLSLVSMAVRGRPPNASRWSFYAFTAGSLVFENARMFIGRERFFLRDFQRNQMYSTDEQRNQRDRQRVREVLYAKKFVTNPLAEYRVKAWQVADRMP